MKKGISLVVVSVAVAVMLILVTIASVTGSGAINTANFDKFSSNVQSVENFVNEYYVENDMLPVTGEIVSKESLGNDFLNAVSENNDLNEDIFVVNMSMLNIPNIEIGIGTVENKDVFLVTKNSQNVYYMRGYSYRKHVYYKF